MRRILTLLLIFGLGFASAYLTLNLLPEKPEVPSLIDQIKPKPLEKYSIEALSQAEITPTDIVIEQSLQEEEKYVSLLFSMSFDPTLSEKTKKKVTGLINIPKAEGLFPVVILLRGYVDQERYKTGDGSKRIGEYFASNGLITVAPDFLGYGESDEESVNIFETRFQTYTTALTLLKSLGSIEKWDKENIFIWGHSNGGQIALTILEITQVTYPTVLWAPVSRPFPYSILYYTNESLDKGKLIRKELANFEALYDTDLYSIHVYYDRIRAPIELHQGTNDDAVPVGWSDDLAKTLLGLKINLDYFKYPGADHNLNPTWSQAVKRSLEFFHDILPDVTSGFPRLNEDDI